MTKINPPVVLEITATIFLCLSVVFLASWTLKEFSVFLFREERTIEQIKQDNYKSCLNHAIGKQQQICKEYLNS